jgi:hypothetical protein
VVVIPDLAVFPVIVVGFLRFGAVILEYHPHHY